MKSISPPRYSGEPAVSSSEVNSDAASVTGAAIRCRCFAAIYISSHMEQAFQTF